MDAANDILTNSKAVSKYGYRHAENLQSLNVLIYNKCQSSLSLLYDSLPQLLLSPSRCSQVRKKSDILIEPLPGLNLAKNIWKHFTKCGWVMNNQLGPIQFCHDSVRI